MRDHLQFMLTKLIFMRLKCKTSCESIGSFAFGLSFILFTYILVDCIRNGKPAEARPWGSAKGLEWTLAAPVAYHTFDEPPTRAEILAESQHS
mgnify:CR=1 FL=1